MTEFILSPDAPAVRDRLRSFLDALSDRKKWRVTIVRYQKRTTPQNSLFHKWVHEIAVATGNDAHDVKEGLKQELLQPRTIAMGDKLVEVRRSTAALNVDEMAAFMTRVQGWAGSEGIALTQPEEMHQ